MEEREYVEILASTKSNLVQSGSFVALFEEVLRQSRSGRLYSWLDFMNSKVHISSVVHYEKTIIAILDTFYTSDVLYAQTDYEFKLSLKFYDLFFQQIKDKCILFLDILPAKKLLILSYLFSKYHGMLQHSIHNQLASLSDVVNEDQLTDIIIKSFVKYETPHYLISNIQKLNSVEIQFLMEAIQGNNLRESPVFPFPISKKEFSRLMTLKIDSKEFRSDIILRGLILVKISNGQHDDFNLITVFLISSNTFNTEPLKYLLDLEYWQKAYHLLVELFIEDYHRFDISRCVDFLEFKKYHDEKIFSLKGRTTASLIRLIDEWHGTVFRMNFSSWRKEVWEKSVHSDLYFNYNGSKYFCKELNSGELLYQEGQKMKHCVITYTPQCLSGEHIIWSLKKQDLTQQDFISFLTIEVIECEIVQIEGLNNRFPDSQELNIVSNWAKQVGFKLSEIFTGCGS